MNSVLDSHDNVLEVGDKVYKNNRPELYEITSIVFVAPTGWSQLSYVYCLNVATKKTYQILCCEITLASWKDKQKRIDKIIGWSIAGGVFTLVVGIWNFVGLIEVNESDRNFLTEYASEFPELVPELKQAYENEYVSWNEYGSLKRHYDKLSAMSKLPNGKVPVETEIVKTEQ